MTVTAPTPTPDDGPFKGPSKQDALVRIPLAQIHESPHNPRTHYDPEALQQLADSLLQSGQLEPVLVRPRKGGGYELAAGHRRFRAAKLAMQQSPEGARFRGLHELLAIVRDLDDKAFIETLNVDNLQRADLHPLEEAQGFSDLMKSCGYDVKKIAARIGKSERYVYDSLTLPKLLPEAKNLFLEGRFERGHAILLARLTPEWQKKALSRQFNRYGDGRGALWEADIFDQEPGQQRLTLNDQVKPVSVRELQTWIDDHVRAAPAGVDPVLFPSAADLLARAQAAKGRAAKIIHITYQRQVPYTARDPKTKTYGAEAWKRADGQFGSKPCDHSIVGFVAAGPRRNDAFLVCINKEKCPIHWRDWQQERERRRKALAKTQKTRARVDGILDDEPKKPAKPEPPQPDEACHQRVGDAILADLYPGILKAVRAIMAQLTMPDEIVWNLTCNILDSDGLNEWATPPKRPGYFGGAYLDEAGLWERGFLPKLLHALPGEYRSESDHRSFKNAAGARTALAVEIYLVRDYDPDAIEKRFDREVKTAWAAELKARAKATPAKPAKATNPAAKAKAKGKKR